MKFRRSSARLAFVPAVLFLVLAFARPERRVVWALIGLVFLVIALRKSKAGAGPVA